MKLSRRQVLATGTVALTAPLAGCIGGPTKTTSLTVSLRGSFESNPPITVPLTIDVFLQNVGSKDVALRGVDVILYNAAKEPLGRHRIGDISREDTEPEYRETKEYDSWFWLTSTAYRVAKTIEITIDVEEIPEWITYQVEDVWFGDENGDDTQSEQSESLFVGTARASTPAPEFTANVLEYVSNRPPPSIVDTDSFRSRRIEQRRATDSDIGESEPLLPNEPIQREIVWHTRSGEDRAQFEEALETFNDGRQNRVDYSKIPDDRQRTLDVLEQDDSEKPHVFESRHTAIPPYFERGFLSDQSEHLEVSPQKVFIEPAAEAVTIDGKVVGLPYAFDTIALLYNRGLVAEPPKTVAEMKRVMDRYHDPDSNEYGLTYPLSSPYAYSAWAHAFGGYYYDIESDSLGLTDPETLQGITFVIDELYPYTPVHSDTTTQTTAFTDGNSPFAIGNAAHVFRAKKNGIDVGVTTLPTIENNSPRPYVTVDAFYFTDRIAEETSIPLTTSFAEWYVTNTDVLVRTARNHGRFPVYENAITSTGLPRTAGQFVSTSRTGILEPPATKMETIYSRVQAAIELVIRDEKSVAEALSVAETEIRDDWGRDVST